MIVVRRLGAAALAGAVGLVLTVAPGVAWAPARADSTAPLAATTPNGPTVAGTLGSLLSATPVVATGGTTPYKWTATGLPKGLTLASTTGKVTGTPSVAGSSVATITVTDATKATLDTSVTFAIAYKPIVVRTTALRGTSGLALTGKLGTATGGNGVYTWSATGLPPGVNVDPATGALSGAPTAGGTFDVTVTVADGSGLTATATTTITVAYGALALSIVGGTTTATVSAVVGSSVAATPLVASGGDGVYTWSANGLPAGLALDPLTGTVTGTATAAIKKTVTITVKDSSGKTASKSVSFVITYPALVLSTNGGTTVSGNVGSALSITPVTAAGGDGHYTFTATGLPSGVTVNSGTGLISGTPKAMGSVAVTIKVKDGSGLTASVEITLSIGAQKVTVTIKTAVVTGKIGTVLTASPVTAAGGTGAYTWSATGLPDGVRVDPSSGALSGVPTDGGDYDVTITATDSSGSSGNAIITISIPYAPFSVTTPGGTTLKGSPNLAFDATPFVVTGGDGNYDFETDENAPWWLTIDTSTGEMSGTPDVAGTSTTVVTVTDGDGHTARVTITIQILQLKLTMYVVQGVTFTGSVNTDMSFTPFGVSGGDGNYTWSLGKAPDWLSVDSSSGQMYGTPDAARTSKVNLTVTDGSGQTATQVITIVIGPDPNGTGDGGGGGKAVRPKLGDPGSPVVPVGEKVTWNVGVALAGTWTYKATGLPKGLVITKKGVITGIPTKASKGTITVTVTGRAKGSKKTQTAKLTFHYKITR